MPDIRKITDDIYVAPQLAPGDIAKLDEYQFRSIVCNRPDGEELSQPVYADIEREADALGIAIEFQPVNAAVISDADVDRFTELVEELPKPLLAYCRSGTRCSVLWALSQAGERDSDDIISMARQAGYSLDALRDRIEVRAADRVGRQ